MAGWRPTRGYPEANLQMGIPRSEEIPQAEQVPVHHTLFERISIARRTFTAAP